MGLNDAEFGFITELLGRSPSYSELGMFAVMWSEHCGYKYSRPILNYFSGYKKAMEGQGLENAGIVPIGDGLGITMKVESHNHPSAVEPYQGAATGVGGIIRDILTMGARPIAGLNSLRFGPIHDGEAPPEIVARNRYLMEHVVSGIAGYGNCVGVPTVAGEVNFHPRYSGNPLVNAMCVGILKLHEVTTAAAAGVGNPVIYLGSATGKDGIHGATFASTELDEESESKRPNVQIGDPFAEKIVIEATLEALQTGAIVAIQDMGAAGLTCSTIEMAAKGDVGMRIDLDLVPMREQDMTGYELLLSESQERMLCVAHAGREQEVIDVFHKWGTQAVVIGHVTDDGLVTITRHGHTEAHVDPHLLADRCPTYISEKEEPAYFGESATFEPSSLPASDPHASLLALLAHPDVASKKWIFHQFDQQVQTQTIVGFGRGDAAVIAPRGTQKAVSVKLDGNARWTYQHPYRGGVLAVIESARNVACTGAMPAAVTDGLNFGSPQQPHVYWQFDRAVKGIADAAEAIQTPVVSGNVSFYNESELGEVLPTPLIGMLGIMDSPQYAVSSAPSGPCDLILVKVPEVESAHAGLGASLFLSVVHHLETGYPEMPNIAGERQLHQFLVSAAKLGILTSAHDVSDGGLAVCLAEVALGANDGHGLGISAKIEHTDSALFGEHPGYVVVGTQDVAAVHHLAQELGLESSNLGVVRAELGIELHNSIGKVVNWTHEALRQAYEYSIPNAMRA